MPAPETIFYKNPIEGAFFSTRTEGLIEAFELDDLWETIDDEEATLLELEKIVDEARHQMHYWRAEQRKEEEEESKRNASSAAESLYKKLLDDAKFAADKKKNDEFKKTHGGLRLALPTDDVPTLEEMKKENRASEKVAGEGAKIKMCINDCGRPIDELEDEGGNLLYNKREHAGKLDCETCEINSVETKIEPSASWWYCPYPCPVCQRMMKQYSEEPPTYNDTPTPCSIECADYLKEHYKKSDNSELMYSEEELASDD